MWQRALNVIGGGGTEPLDKNHVWHLKDVEPISWTNGTAVTFVTPDITIWNIKEWNTVHFAANNTQNISLYFVKSDGTVTSKTGTSFSPNPFTCTDYDYLWVQSTTGTRIITLTFT